MTSQSRADVLLAAWQLLRLQGIAPGLRLPVIDALCEIERTKTSLERNKMATVNVDFAWNEYLQDVLVSIHKHQGEILSFNPTGLGGGNPNLILQFPDKGKGLAFLNERYPDDKHELNQSRLI